MSSTLSISNFDNLLEKMKIFISHNGERAAQAAAVMGPNGSGKTRFLRAFHEKCLADGIPTLYISAFRNINNPGGSAQYHHYTQTGVSHKFARLEDLLEDIIHKLFAPAPAHSARSAALTHSLPLNFEMAINIMIEAVIKKDVEIEGQNDAAIIKWNRNDRDAGAAAPLNQPIIWPNLKKLLDRIFGYDFFIASVENSSPEARELKYNLDGKVLSLQDLSGGERQILLMSILLLSNSTENYTVIVDEPELHLNEQKAIDVWKSVEEKLPNSKFVYATHNVAFATRGEIGALHLMRRDGSIEWMDLDEPLPSYALKEIVGSRIQLLRTELPVIFCEDELSKAIIGDMFSGEKFAVVVVGGKDAVIRGARPDDVWNRLIAGDRKCCGIVDRDARQDNQVDHLERKGTFCLPFNEIESILLHPSIVVPLVQSISSKGAISETDYVKLVCSTAHSELNNSLVTLQGYIVDQTRIKIKHTRSGDLVTVGEIEGLEDIKKQFSLYANRLLQAILSNEIKDVISLSCGKEVYGRIARSSVAKIGIAMDPDALKFYNMIRDKNIVLQNIRDLPGMSALIEKVQRKLG